MVIKGLRLAPLPAAIRPTQADHAPKAPDARPAPPVPVQAQVPVQAPVPVQAQANPARRDDGAIGVFGPPGPWRVSRGEADRIKAVGASDSLRGDPRR